MKDIHALLSGTVLRGRGTGIKTDRQTNPGDLRQVEVIKCAGILLVPFTESASSTLPNYKEFRMLIVVLFSNLTE